jgi:hypothetical protein
MKKLILTVLFIFAFTNMVMASPFKDVSPSHWAYDAVAKLSASGHIQGYKDGSFKGDKTLTRYELAMVISRMMGKMNMNSLSNEDLRTLERLIVEFSDELALLGVKITSLEEELKIIKSGACSSKSQNGKIQMSGDMKLSFNYIDREYDTVGFDDTYHFVDYGMNFFANIDEHVSAFVRFAAYSAQLENLGNTDTFIDEAYVDVKNFFDLGDIRIGRQWMSLGHSIVLDDKMDGIKFSKTLDQVAFTLFAFSTRDANKNNVNYYGNNNGRSNFWLFDDSNNTADADHSITLYNSPYAGSRPFDGYTGNAATTPKTSVFHNHQGLATNVAAGALNPLAFTAVGAVPGYGSNGFAAGADFNGDGVLETWIANGAFDTDNDGIQDATEWLKNANALDKEFRNETASGFDSWGINVSVDFGGHALAGYFLQRDYESFDPYTIFGDPWATMVDANNDGFIDVDVAGNIVSPGAEPTYFGITLDGNIFRNVDYYLEYVTFDPDVNNVGVNPLTGQATKTATANDWNGNNLDEGSAWLVGIDWDLTDDINLIIQYGVGDEEFIPASINSANYLNGMSGYRPEDLFYRNSFTLVGAQLGNPFDTATQAGVGTGSLTGIKDLLIKLSADFNEKTSGFIKYEAVSENDSSAERLISGDPLVTGHERQEYDLITLSFKHIYKPNTILRLQYDYLKYDSDAVNNANVIGNEKFVTDDVNGGGWSCISADISIQF